jgi:hypothetical protein
MCVLRIHGKAFDAYKYLALSGFKAIKVFRAGESHLPLTQPEGERYQFSEITVNISDASWKNVNVGQVEDAIAFLKEHEDKITMLRSAPGVEEMYLDFPVDLRIDRFHIMVQGDYNSQQAPIGFDEYVGRGWI